MTKTPTYTQKPPQQQKQDAALNDWVCMASDSLRMQNQDDRAPMTDAILNVHGSSKGSSWAI